MKPLTFLFTLLFSFTLVGSVFGQTPTGVTYGGLVQESGTSDTVNMNNAFINGMATSADTADVIFFVHGLGSKTDAWSQAQSATSSGVTNGNGNYLFSPGKYIRGYLNTYKQNSGIIEAGTDLAIENAKSIEQYTWKPYFEPRHESYIIAHSQGGLVSRAAIRQMQMSSNVPDSLVGGLVTFGTPHQGAAILNNGLPVSEGGAGQIQAFANEMCNYLLDPEIKTSINNLLGSSDFISRTIIRGLIGFEAPNRARSFACDAGAASIPLIADDLIQNTVQDYKVGSSYLEDTLNTFIPADIPQVAFWGEENPPVFWRLANSLAYDVVQDPVFGAGDDSTRFDYKAFRASVDGNIRMTQDSIDSWKDSFSCNWRWILLLRNPILAAWLSHDCNTRLVDLRRQKKAWEEALRYVDDANHKWESIIGARRDTIVSDLECVCDVAGVPNKTVSYPIDSIEECGSNPHPGMVNCQAQTSYRYTTYRLPNDGIVTAESARALPGKTVLYPDEDNYILKGNIHGSNHMQMRNDEHLKTKLDRLYDGEYGRFFRIERK